MMDALLVCEGLFSMSAQHLPCLPRCSTLQWDTVGIWKDGEVQLPSLAEWAEPAGESSQGIPSGYGVKQRGRNLLMPF